MQVKVGRMAVQRCFCAQGWNLGKTVLEKAVGLQPNFLDDLRNDTGTDSDETMVTLAAIRRNIRNMGCFKDALKWYMLALDRIEQNREVK